MKNEKRYKRFYPEDPGDINTLFSSVEVGKCLGLYTEQKLEGTLSLLLGYLRYNVSCLGL